MSGSETIRRRTLLRAASVAGLALVGRARAEAVLPDGNPQSREEDLVRRVAGGHAVLSPRVRLNIPAVFTNGYSVPMNFAVDSPMSEADYVRVVHVLAPLNPFVVVARFYFTPLAGQAEIATRIRLAKPQNVLAVAEMNDGTLLMARSHVTVETDGCS